MMPRIERQPGDPKRVAPTRRARSPFAAPDDGRNPELALAYSNGYVTVEVSHEALDAYIAANGDVPLPVADDPQTRARRAYDARNRVRVVYDEEAKLREVATRSADGLFVRINFTDPARDRTR